MTPTIPAGWSMELLPGASSGVELVAVKRSAIARPLRYRVVVIPGSGCTGWLPLAERYFAGLLHAEVLALHKPKVDITAGAGADCSAEFIQSDALSTWRDHAQAALQSYEGRLRPDPQIPQVLVGISEGAELLPDLAPVVSSLAGLVMISASALDPREAGELQSARRGQPEAWRTLERAQSSDARDDTVVEGRTLRYWRDVWTWKLTQPLFNAPWPLLRAWGESDLLVPPAAYQQFAHRVRERPAPFCDMQLAGADHGLQLRGRDGIQWLWTRLENWARSRSMNVCASLLSPQLLQEGSLRNVPIGTASVTGAHLRQRANLQSVGADGF